MSKTFLQKNFTANFKFWTNDFKLQYTYGNICLTYQKASISKVYECCVKFSRASIEQR